MQRKTYSRRLELYVIRTLTLEPESRETQFLLSKIDESYFASETARQAYRLCLKSLKKKSELPDWNDLVTDTNLDETIRDDLEECDFKPLSGKVQVKKVLRRLDEYRKTRLLTKIGRNLDKLFNSTEPFNVDDEVANVQSILSSAATNRSFEVLRIGRNSNVKKYFKKMMDGSSLAFVPTGFAGFDSVNRGIPAGSAMLLASPTGNGKSAMANQIAENMASTGAKVGLVPLEMANLEMLMRNVARLGEIDMTKLLDPKNRLNSEERRNLYLKLREFDKRIDKLGGSIEYYEFNESVTIEAVTATVKPFGLDVLIIDYIGLLDETSGDLQWQAMSDIIRFLHIWGKANGVITISLAQLSEDGALRYSKGMAEHAKFFWWWKMDSVSRSSGVVEVFQRKARNASDHSFLLLFDLAKMTIVDADKTAIEAHKKLQEESNKGGGKRWKKDKEQMGWGDEEDYESDDDVKPKPGHRAKGKKPASRGEKNSKVVEF